MMLESKARQAAACCLLRKNHRYISLVDGHFHKEHVSAIWVVTYIYLLKKGGEPGAVQPPGVYEKFGTLAGQLMYKY